jgi:hypothetical protein
MQEKKKLLLDKKTWMQKRKMLMHKRKTLARGDDADADAKGKFKRMASDKRPCVNI